MKKVMILGSAGMLGHMVYSFFEKTGLYKIVDSSYPIKFNPNSYLLDVNDNGSIEKFIKDEKPDIVINCIGILVSGSQNNPGKAIYLNSYFPHQLSKLMRETGGKLIQISTDCVFSGRKGNYSESDFRDADDYYGRSKALGEINNGKDLTIRTSIIGPEINNSGTGLFHWFMNQTGKVNGYSKVYWSGVTTLELAKAIHFCIENEVMGLVQLTNGSKISKYDLLTLIKKVWNKKDVEIITSDLKNEDKSLIRSERLKYTVPSYFDMLSELYTWIETNKHLYHNIYK